MLNPRRVCHIYSTFPVYLVIGRKYFGGRSGFDINTRIIIAFREIGKGFTALLSFCGFMNIPPPMTQKSFGDIQDYNVISS